MHKSRLWQVVVAHGRSEEPVVNIRPRHDNTDQAERANLCGCGDELVTPVQPQAGERSLQAAGQAVDVGTELYRFNVLDDQFITGFADEFAVVAPVGAVILGSREAQRKWLGANKQIVERAGGIHLPSLHLPIAWMIRASELHLWASCCRDPSAVFRRGLAPR